MNSSQTLTDQINVLLVEDEISVRNVIRRILQEQGYAISEAADGEEGAHLAENWQGPMHLLITDLFLPRVSGFDLARQVLMQHRQTKVLYLSGYSEDLIIGQEIVGPHSAFLQKPFALPVFIQKIRSLLNLAQSGDTWKLPSLHGHDIMNSE